MSFTFELTGGYHGPPHAYFDGLVASGQGVGFEVVQIADRWYVLDLASDRYRITTVPAMRPQEDTSPRPGEQSLSNAGLWRRTVSSWHHGAGQRWYDRDDADPYMFNTSRGVDPFTRWSLSLLYDTEDVLSNATGWTTSAIAHFDGEPHLVLAGGGGRCVVIHHDLGESGAIREVSGLTGRVWVASAGDTAYVADDNGIHIIAADAESIESFNSELTGAKIWFAKDRLLAAVGNELWEVVDATSGGSSEEPLYTHPWPMWEWTDATSGGEYIYVSGHSGDRGLVYAIGIDQDATGLLPPLVALELPTGEVPLSVYGYIGIVAVGTTLGLRLAQPEGTGLIIGAAVGDDGHSDAPRPDRHVHPVRCIEGQGRFLWFGQDDLFVDAAGLGRVDLTTFVDTLAPAYASDLMGLTPGVVNTVASYDDRRWFTVGNDLYRETDTHLSSGFLDAGRISMNITDEKVAVYADLRHDYLPTGASIELWMSTAALPFTLRGISAQPNTERPAEVFTLNHNRTVWHEPRAVLQSGDDSPTLTAMTLAAQPVPDRSQNLFLPLLLHGTINYVDNEFGMDVRDEFNFLTELARSQRLIRFRHGELANLGFVEDFEWVPHQPSDDGSVFEGTMVLKLKTAEAER